MDMGTTKHRGLHQAQSGPGNHRALLGCRQRYWTQRAHRTDPRSRRGRRIPRRGTSSLSHDLSGPAQTICLHTSDSADQWTARAGTGSTQLTPASDHADAAVTATASDLLLLLWGRRSPKQVQVDGDIAALQRFLARTHF